MASVAVEALASEHNLGILDAAEALQACHTGSARRQQGDHGVEPQGSECVRQNPLVQHLAKTTMGGP